MRTIDLLDLPAAARDAFARAINDNRVLLAKRAAGWTCVLPAVAGGLLLLAVSAWGFGGQDEALVSQVPGLVTAYALGFAGLLGSVLLGLRFVALKRLLGCAPGVYALGSLMIDARSRKLRLYDLFATEPLVVHDSVNGTYRASWFTWHGFRFSFRRWDLPDQIVSNLYTQLCALRGLAGTHLLEHDPIATGLSLRTATSTPRSRALLALAAMAIAIVSLGLAIPTWSARNRASVAAAVDRVHEKMELELQDVVVLGADNAGILRDALARYPDAPDELRKPVEVALATRYKDARAAALALSSSESLTAFIDQVYDRIDASGAVAVMQIEVARTDNSALTRFDHRVAADPRLSAHVVPVASYFAPSRNAVHAEALTAAVQQGLAQFFPSDIMVFSDVASANEAKITIFYVIRPRVSSDGDVVIYQQLDANHDPVPGSQLYPSVEFELGATLEVPGGMQPQRVTFTARPAPLLAIVSAHGVTGALDSSSVYREMADSAFADLQHELVAALGGKSFELPVATARRVGR